METEEVRLAWAALAALCAFGQTFPGPPRKALVIVNSAYRSLPSPAAKEDGALVADALTKAGFTVETRQDLTRAQLLEIESKYIPSLPEGSVILVYFAGFALHAQGSNWLAGVDFDPKAEGALETRAYSLNRLLLFQDRSPAALYFLLETPYQDEALMKLSAGRGLEPIEVNEKTLVTYAVPPSRVLPVPSRAGSSVFARALAQALEGKGQPISRVLRDELPRIARTLDPARDIPRTDTLIIDDPLLRPADPKPVSEPKVIEKVVAPVKAPPKRGDLWENPKDEIKYLFVEPGAFTMGCVEADGKCRKDEQPAHEVTLTHGFWMARNETTVKAYRQFAQETSRTMPQQTDTNKGWGDTYSPITRISWVDADAYCKWAGGRLPTEAEWEYSARAGKKGLVYSWGNTISRARTNYDGTDKKALDKYPDTAPVGTFPPNDWGLLDMEGNVSEWVADYYDVYAGGAATDPAGPASGTKRISRGGSFAGVADELRLSAREAFEPQRSGNRLGFRCVIVERPEDRTK